LLAAIVPLLVSRLAAAATAPPPIPREFRGMWIATVGNIDWPSKPGLPTAKQKEELTSLLDLAKRLNLNAVVFQVRTGCDALYASKLEPWSEYLTGRMGTPPQPAWDPLAYAVQEAHERGLELHAWFNPYRARYHQALSPVSPDHVSRTRPDLTVKYGRFLWLDPGNPASREHTLQVVRDVVRRYDVDGIHIDDYFYPYPERTEGTGSGTSGLVPFPDSASWSRYRREGGNLDLSDWRRENVNILVRDLGAAIHNEKPWVKFGVSPFGIWRPGSPPGIKGLDQHELLFADVRKWMREGLADYMAPQLYWPERQEGQRFSRLLDWWAQENTAGRHLWPGLNSADIGKTRTAGEVLWQVKRIGDHPKSDGILFWNASSLKDDRGALARELLRGPFARKALVPACPWLGGTTPAAPGLTVSREKSGMLRARIASTPDDPPSSVVVQSLDDTGWKTQILPGVTREFLIAKGTRGRFPAEVRVRMVGRTGFEGAPAVWRSGP
jgi:uncharacterized lipoprotein YddW (UPF0748 family)